MSKADEKLPAFEKELTALWWTAEMKPVDVMRLLRKHLARMEGRGEGLEVTRLEEGSAMGSHYRPAAPPPTPQVQNVCTCPEKLWIGADLNDSTCPLTEEEHRKLEQVQPPPTPQVEELARELLEAMETCHICQGQLILQEYPVHCEDCSSDCENHAGEECVPIYVLHDRLRRALKVGHLSGPGVGSVPRCPKCGESNPDLVFCNSCGHKSVWSEFFAAPREGKA